MASCAFWSRAARVTPERGFGRLRFGRRLLAGQGEHLAESVVASGGAGLGEPLEQDGEVHALDLRGGKRVITDIDRSRGEGASGTCTQTLYARGLGVNQVLFSDVPFPLLETKVVRREKSEHRFRNHQDRPFRSTGDTETLQPEHRLCSVAPARSAGPVLASNDMREPTPRWVGDRRTGRRPCILQDGTIEAG